MSKVTDIRDALNLIIQTALPTYMKLTDSIDTIDNANIMLRKGFRVGYGPADNSSREWCMTHIQRRRQFSFALTNAYVPNLDADGRQDAEDVLMDDQNKVVKAVHRDPELTGVAISSDFAFDNGIEYLLNDSGEKQYIMIVTTISVDYYEGV
jgi:hypothetical protein